VTESATTARLERVELPEADLAAWRRLAERSGNVFATPEWLLAWWRALDQGDLQLWSWGDPGAPQALLPLHLHEGTLSFLGHPQADVLGPVCAPDDREPAARALASLLQGDAIPWESFRGDDLPADVPWAELLDAEVVDRTPCPVVPLPGGGWEEFLAGRSRNFRSQVRGRERRLAEAGRLSYRSTERPEELERDFDAFLALHEARWEGPTSSFRGLRAFHLDFLAQALERGWLRLRFLELDGEPVASLYNLRFGNAESHYQAGRDPARARESVGFVLHVHAIREALADGLSEYRLLRGGEPYKTRFATQTSDLVSVRRRR
jgi:CelD/BcsL family acetyltransferase involved in cellulose biosynthesis